MQNIILDLKHQIELMQLPSNSIDILVENNLLDFDHCRAFLCSRLFPSYMARHQSHVYNSMMELAARYDCSLSSVKRYIYCRPMKGMKVLKFQSITS